jgi:hypothetical protein
VVATEERTRATVPGKRRVIDVQGHAVLPNRSRSDEPTLADLAIEEDIDGLVESMEVRPGPLNASVYLAEVHDRCHLSLCRRRSVATGCRKVDEAAWHSWRVSGRDAITPSDSPRGCLFRTAWTGPSAEGL